MPTIDKIKRNLVWLRKVLGIIDKTTLPGTILGEVRPTMEVFGWDRLPETITVENIGAAATAFVVSAVVPVEVCRLVFAASVVSSDNVIEQDLFVTHRGSLGTQRDVTIGGPTHQLVGFAGVPAATPRIICLQAGERIVGNSRPAPGVGEELTLTFRMIDLPIGEYIPDLT